jgi:hypothetical protein
MVPALLVRYAVLTDVSGWFAPPEPEPWPEGSDDQILRASSVYAPICAASMRNAS